jgi:hypothetical protein
MRIVALWLLTIAACLAAATDPSLEALKSRVESTPPGERPPLCIQIARLQLANADKLYTDGKVDEARAAVDDIVAYSEKARDAAKASRKHLKNVEIGVRKMSERLRDIKRTLAFEDQPPVDQAVQRLEDVRTTLLAEMFKKEKKQ